jgi:hypothetical protein
VHNLGGWFAMEFAFVPLLVLCVNELVKEEEKKSFSSVQRSGMTSFSRKDFARLSKLLYVDILITLNHKPARINRCRRSDSSAGIKSFPV